MNLKRLALLSVLVALGCSGSPAPPPPPPPAPPPPAPVVPEPGCEPEGIFAALPAEETKEIYDDLTDEGDTRKLYDDEDPYDDKDLKATAKHYYEVGRKADAEKRWDAAHRAFEESWSRSKSPYFAFALAKVSMSLGRPSEVLHYVDFVIRSRSFGEKQRADAGQWKNKALGEISWLDIHAERGACVLIGPLKVGLTPLGSPVVVDPGKHRVEVRHQGKRKSEEVTTSKGAVARVTLKLE